MNVIRGIFVRPILCAQHGEEWRAPTTLEWMPAGQRVIRCMGPDGPIETETATTPEDAAKLDAQLQLALQRANSGEASRPFVDFDHEGGAAAAIPKRIFWDEGIRMEVEWTDAGLAALKGRTYSYFSPTWIHGKDNHPEALPEFGPIGSLVNTPAFQDIERLAAKQAAPAAERTNTMETLIAKLVAAGLVDKPEATPNEDELVATLAAKFKAMNDMADTNKTECEAHKAKLIDLTKAFAASDVEAAVACGKIDKDAAKEWEADYHADPMRARKRLASIRVAAKGADISGLGNASGGEKKAELTGLQRAIAARKAQIAK